LRPSQKSSSGTIEPLLLIGPEEGALAPVEGKGVREERGVRRGERDGWIDASVGVFTAVDTPLAQAKGF